MKTFKVRFLLKPYFFIPLCIIVLVILSFVFWYLTPSRPLSVVVVDKTVPATAADSWSYLGDVSNNYRKHVGLYWMMNYLKIVNPETQKPYDYSQDYFGPKLDENSSIIGNDTLTQLKEIPDILYLSDTYGVEINDDRGISAEEMNTISLCHEAGTVVVGEQDILTTATSDEVRGELENLFGISTTGWVGRYIYDLQDLTDVPYWAPDMWRAKYGQEWNCAGAGILLVSSSGDILVLEEKTDFQSKNLLNISIAEEYQKEFGKHSLNFYNWFELIEADQATEVLATYSFNVNSTGAEELAAVSDTTTFAAVTRLQKPSGACSYYFAGDFNDYTTNLQISNFLFADKFFQLLSFDRDGDVTHFYWNFYAPIMKKILKDAVKDPVVTEPYEERQIAKADQNGFQVLIEDEWTAFEVKGFNINGESPGDMQYQYSGDYTYYSELLKALSDMGGNCVRTYDLLPPEFYRALHVHNQTAESPIYLIQGILTPPEIAVQDSFENIENIKNNITATIAAIHGTGEIDGNGVREKMNYVHNVAPYLIAYIIDPRLDAESSDMILSGAFADADYQGEYISAADNGIESLAAELCDHALRVMKETYGCMQPVSICSGAERLTGSSWSIPEQRTYNLSHLQVADAAEGLYFASYSLRPDDAALLGNENYFAGMYQDILGAFSWGGYIQEVRNLCSGPVLIDRAGLSTNSDMFEQEISVNGLSEQEQGDGIVRMLKAADDQQYMGMLIADLNDNWSSSSDQIQPYTVPISNNGLWQNPTDRAETTGIVAVESQMPKEVAVQLNDNSEKSIMQQMQISYNETYIYLTLLLNADIDYDISEMMIGIDTYQRNDGEYFYDANYYANSQSGMEYVIKFESKTSAALYVSRHYNRNLGNYATAESYAAEYDLVSSLRYGNFTVSNTHFYQAGVTVHIRIPWAMLNFTDPANALVVSGAEDSVIKTTVTDGMIFSVLVGNKESMDTVYIFPESKKSAGYKRLEPKPWTAADISYVIRPKESAVVIGRYFSLGD